eukprot:5888287-Amphidinium_carterae.1
MFETFDPVECSSSMKALGPAPQIHKVTDTSHVGMQQCLLYRHSSPVRTRSHAGSSRLRSWASAASCCNTLAFTLQAELSEK